MKDLQAVVVASIKEQFVPIQMMVEPVTAKFLADLVDIEMIDEDWLELPESDKRNRIKLAIEQLEKEGFLVSSTTKVGERNFQDDLYPPTLPQRVKVYRKNR